MIVEIVVYLSAFVYLVLHLPVFGNPNSLGAVMGVVAVPLLLWGVLTAEGRTSTAGRFWRSWWARAFCFTVRRALEC